VPDPAGGSSANHYLRTLSRVREELTQRANRASLKLDSSLGMPELSPTVEREILRYLEALDLVETVSDLVSRLNDLSKRYVGPWVQIEHQPAGDFRLLG